MIEVGTKLGGKYFITERQERVAVGARFEVRTAQGEVRWAQWLHDEALSAGQVAQLQGDLSALPAHAAFRSPDELVTSQGGLPAAIYYSPLPKPLTQLTASLTVASQESRRLPALRSLIPWIAALAEALGDLHSARSAHGAISLTHLGAHGDGSAAQVVLSGFGIEPARRAARGGVRPAPRADLSALVLVLHGLLEQVGAKLSGAALVRWDVLRNCARAGDHTALSSGDALATALRDLLADEEATLRAKSAVTKLPSAPEPSADPAVPSTDRWTRRRRLVAGGLAALLAAGAAAVALGANGRGARPSDGQTQTSLATARCGDEPMRPAVGFDLPSSPASISTVCRGDGSLFVSPRSMNGVFIADRASRRGESFRGAPSRVAEGASEHSLLDDPQGPWIAWRNATGRPFGAARIHGDAEQRALSQGDWRADRFRGVWLLRVEVGAVWLASNLLHGGRERAVVLRLPTTQSEAPTAYGLGEGAVIAAIGGQPASLLMREGGSLYTLTVATNALTVLSSTEAAVETIEVREVPEMGLLRSEPWRAEGRWTFAAPSGVAVAGGARMFAVTTGSAPLPEGCVGLPCAFRGEVFALSFADRGAPQASRLSANGRATSIAVESDGTRWIAGVGAHEGERTLWDLRANGVPTEHPIGGGGDLSLLSCGDELWIAQLDAPSSSRVTASPLPCVVLARR